MRGSESGCSVDAARPPRRSGRAALALPLAVSAALTFALALSAAGCKKDVECKAELMTGMGAFKGKATGPAGDASVKRKATKDACSQMCIDTKSVSLDVCSARCVVDAEAGKVGVKITCSDGSTDSP